MITVHFFGFEAEKQSLILQKLSHDMVKRGKKVEPRTIENPHIYEQHFEDDIFLIVPENVVSGLNGIDFSIRLRKRNPLAHLIFFSMNYLSGPYILRNYVRPTGFFLLSEGMSDVLYIFNCIIDAKAQLSDTDKRIEFISKYNRMQIPLSQILFFTTMDKKIVCHLENGESYEFYGTLHKIGKEYSSFFIRCHAGFLVNREKISHVNLSKGILMLTNCDEQIPISRKYRKAFISSYVPVENSTVSVAPPMN